MFLRRDETVAGGCLGNGDVNGDGDGRYWKGKVGLGQRKILYWI